MYSAGTLADHSFDTAGAGYVSGRASSQKKFCSAFCFSFSVIFF